MKKTTDVSLGAVKKERESYTLVNKSGLLNLIIATRLCLLKEIYTNIKMNIKTEIEPI